MLSSEQPEPEVRIVTQPGCCRAVAHGMASIALLVAMQSRCAQQSGSGLRDGLGHRLDTQADKAHFTAASRGIGAMPRHHPLLALTGWRRTLVAEARGCSAAATPLQQLTSAPAGPRSCPLGGADLPSSKMPCPPRARQGGKSRSTAV